MEEIMTPGITRKRGVRGGRPCIAGTGIRVTDIVMSVRYEERSREQIAADLVLTVEQVDAALDYYRKNSEQIDADIVKTDRDIRAAVEGKLWQTDESGVSVENEG